MIVTVRIIVLLGRRVLKGLELNWRFESIECQECMLDCYVIGDGSLF